MLPPIPILAEYGLSERHGFLPEHPPLTRLPDPYYNDWENIVSNLQALILSRRIRFVVGGLAVLSTAGLEQAAEWRRAYSLLCFIANAYIWGGDEPADRLPRSVSVPLQQVSLHLELPPVPTYAALCLWNFKPIFVNEDIDNLENLATLNTFTGSLDESWFYLVSVAIEARGAHVVPLMLAAILAARSHDAAAVTRCLDTFAESLSNLTSLLQRMHENCDPSTFYNRIRPFLAGSKNMTEAGLPNGVFYEDEAGGGEYRQYSGGSNAQSSLIQFFDIVLGIEHRPTGEKAGAAAATGPRPFRETGVPPPTHNFLREMRRYMPGPHDRFLADVSAVANVRQFVLADLRNHALGLAYDACLAMLAAFRDKHIAIVTRYIIMPARRAQNEPGHPTPARHRVNLANSVHAGQRGLENAQGIGHRGTGGTSLIPFLKQARDETRGPAIFAWTRVVMARHHESEAKKDPALELSDTSLAEDEIKVPGLAGSWPVDEPGMGGICNY